MLRVVSSVREKASEGWFREGNQKLGSFGSGIESRGPSKMEERVGGVPKMEERVGGVRE